MKKCFIFALLFSLLVPSVSVFASDPSDPTWLAKQVDELTESEISTYALNFAGMLDITDLSVSGILPVHDLNKNREGYCVSFTRSGVPFGYLVLDFSEKEYVSEFCIKEGIESPYSEMAGGVSIQSEGTYAVQVSPFQKGIVYSDDTYQDQFGYVGDYEAPFSLFALEDNVSWDDLFLMDYDTENASYTEYRIGAYHSEKSFVSQNDIGRSTGRYACVPAAMTAAVHQNDLLWNGSEAETFLKLWDMTDTYFLEDENGSVRTVSYVDENGETHVYQLGSTYDRRIVYALRDYLNDTDETFDYNRIFSPTFEAIKLCAENGSDMIVYSARIRNEKNEITGHCVNVLGYVEITEPNGIERHYLTVADGWHDDAVRYLALDNLNEAGVSPVLVWVRLGDE